MLGQPQCMREVGSGKDMRSRTLKAFPQIKGRQGLIFDYQDTVSSEGAIIHETSPQLVRMLVRICGRIPRDPTFSIPAFVAASCGTLLSR
jgi:hypothetical protein